MRQEATFHQVCATLREREGDRVAVLIQNRDSQMLAVFRGVLRAPDEALSLAGPRFVIDDGQQPGRFDETSFVLLPDDFMNGWFDADTVDVFLHSGDTISIVTDVPLGGDPSSAYGP